MTRLGVFSAHFTVGGVFKPHFTDILWNFCEELVRQLKPGWLSLQLT